MNENMKCPKCGEAMEKGNITLPQNVTWYPGEKAVGFVKDQIFLVGRGLKSVFGKQSEAFLCKKCKWVSFGYPG